MFISVADLLSAIFSLKTVKRRLLGFFRSPSLFFFFFFFFFYHPAPRLRILWLHVVVLSTTRLIWKWKTSAVRWNSSFKKSKRRSRCPDAVCGSLLDEGIKATLCKGCGVIVRLECPYLKLPIYSELSRGFVWLAAAGKKNGETNETNMILYQESWEVMRAVDSCWWGGSLNEARFSPRQLPPSFLARWGCGVVLTAPRWIVFIGQSQSP